MSLRVRDAEVKEIIDTALNTGPFVQAASLLVDRHLGSAGLSAAELKEIERWWAAHLVAIRDPRFVQVRTEGDAIVYERGKMGEGLRATSYGQQVLTLDWTGTLARATTAKRATIHFA